MPDTEITQNNKLQLLGKLNASFVHEIRNPLFAIKLNLDYLKFLENLPGDAVEAIDACIEASSRINFLIENFLDFSRKSKSKIDQFPINELTNQAVELVSGYANKINIQIEKALDDTNPVVNVDKNKIIQVFLNILTNALEAESSNKKIVVKTYTNSSKKITWEVEDFGKGIDKNDGKLIFNDFFTSKESGTGLGLSISKKILEEFNADINFKSELHKGTVFYINFPSI